MRLVVSGRGSVVAISLNPSTGRKLPVVWRTQRGHGSCARPRRQAQLKKGFAQARQHYLRRPGPFGTRREGQFRANILGRNRLKPLAARIGLLYILSEIKYF